MNEHPAESARLARVREWDQTCSIARRQRTRLQLTILVLGGVLVVAGVAAADTRMRWFGIFVVACTLLWANLGDVFRMRPARQAPQHAPMSVARVSNMSYEFERFLAALALPVNVRRFLQSLVGLDGAVWHAIASSTGRTYRDSESLEWPLWELNIRVEGGPSGLGLLRSNRRRRAAIRITRELLALAQDQRARTQFNDSLRAVDWLTDRGIVPFGPPFHEYRAVLRATHAIIGAHISRHNCERALQPFREVLGEHAEQWACVTEDRT
jgi:hypothetical protein